MNLMFEFLQDLHRIINMLPFKKIAFVLLAIFSLHVFSEDMNIDLQWQNIDDYKHRYVLGDGPDIFFEKIDKDGAHFSAETVIGNGNRICDLSGIAHLVAGSKSTYLFAQETCRLTLELSEDGLTVTISDAGDGCGIRVCKSTGVFNGKYVNHPGDKK